MVSAHSKFTNTLGTWAKKAEIEPSKHPFHGMETWSGFTYCGEPGNMAEGIPPCPRSGSGCAGKMRCGREAIVQCEGVKKVGIFETYPALLYEDKLSTSQHTIPGVAIMYNRRMVIIDRDMVAPLIRPDLNETVLRYVNKIFLPNCLRSLGLNPDSKNDRKALVTVMDKILNLIFEDSRNMWWRDSDILKANEHDKTFGVTAELGIMDDDDTPRTLEEFEL